LVVSRNRDLQLAGAEVVHSLEEALKQLADVPRVFIIGGEQLFKQAFAEADQLYLTEIDLEVAGDTFFEVPDPQDWQEVESVEGQEGEIRFRFLTLERKK
jgi:dihydrofolate reductase